MTDGFPAACSRVKALAITDADMAVAMGVSVASIRAARRPLDSDGARPPPGGWRPALARLLRERARALESMAVDVEQAGE
jgi:hypothetical protein